MPSSAVLNTGTLTTVVTIKHEIAETKEEPQRTANTADLCATLLFLLIWGLNVLSSHD